MQYETPEQQAEQRPQAQAARTRPNVRTFAHPIASARAGDDDPHEHAEARVAGGVHRLGDVNADVRAFDAFCQGESPKELPSDVFAEGSREGVRTMHVADFSLSEA